MKTEKINKHLPYILASIFIGILLYFFRLNYRFLWLVILIISLVDVLSKKIYIKFYKKYYLLLRYMYIVIAILMIPHII